LPLEPTTSSSTTTTSSTSSATTSSTTTPTDQIDDVLADIDALVEAGGLASGPSRGLTQHVEHALRDIDRGKTQQACTQLSAFVSQANGKANGGVLDDDDAADLTAQVQAIRSQLGCDGASVDPDHCRAADRIVLQRG